MRWRAIAMTVLVAGLGWCSAARAVSLSAVVSAQPVAPGQEFTVSVQVGTAQDPVQDLYGIGLQLQFNPAAVTVLGQTRGAMPGGADVVEFSQQGNGLLAYSVCRTQQPGAAGHGEVLLVRMLARPDAPSGNYPLTLGDVEAINSVGESISLGLMNADLHVVGPEGACCSVAGTCQTLLPDACAAAGGEFKGEGVPCDPNPCPPPVGACCLPNGACQLLTAEACTTAVGVYQGDATTCEPNNPCPQPPPVGACCTRGGKCTVTTQADCAVTSTWTQDGVCVPNTCQVPETGSCCFRNSYCMIFAPARCTALRGTWVGDAVCTPSANPRCLVLPPRGGDLLPDGSAPAEQKDSWGHIKNRYR
jgi:hypothetical protein